MQSDNNDGSFVLTRVDQESLMQQGSQTPLAASSQLGGFESSLSDSLAHLHTIQGERF
jgi:hypothetical protein